MYRRSHEDRAAEQATGCVLGLVVFLLVAIGRFFADLFAPTPTGIRVGQVVNGAGSGREIGIAEPTKHVAILGATGAGKSTLLTRLMIQLMEAGHGVAIIDAKGDLIPDLLPHIPLARFEDVIWFAPTDREHPLGFNMLEEVPVAQRSRVASEVVSIFHKLSHESWGPRLEYLMIYAVRTLLEIPGATLLDIPQLLLDDDYRRARLAQVNDPVMQEFWAYEYELLSHAQRVQAVMPILARLGPWLAFPEVRNIIGQRHSSFSTRTIMDTRKIFLAHLPLGELGEIPASLLGAMLVSKFQIDAMTRTDLPPLRRVPFFLCCDEFQHFVTPAFETAITQLRAMNVGVFLSHQFSQQLPQALALTINRNVAVRLVCSLENGQHRVLYQRPQDTGAPDLALRPLPPPVDGKPMLAQQLMYYSRQRYGRPRRTVEQAMMMRRQRGENNGNARLHPRPQVAPTALNVQDFWFVADEPGTPDSS